MTKSKESSRRRFLKNTSLSFLSLSSFIGFAKSVTVSKSKDTNCNLSTEDAYGQGPFYTTNAPFLQNGQLANQSEPGERIIISGRIYNLDCTKVIPDVEIDVWHANHNGEYDNIGYNLRGKTFSNNQGFYTFETIKPGFYLNGAIFRPSHIHFKITPPGHNTLITQLYFQNDPYISTDAAASIDNGVFDASSRIIPLVLNSHGILEGTWDIVINGDGITLGLNNMHLDKGIIYKASPNPFTEKIDIYYGVFEQASVGIFIYDLKGQLVARLDEKILKPDKYSICWRPQKNIPSGYYFISIKINDLHVHHIKVYKK